MRAESIEWKEKNRQLKEKGQGKFGGAGRRRRGNARRIDESSELRTQKKAREKSRIEELCIAYMYVV